MDIKELFDPTHIEDLDVGGRGGKESELNKLFPTLVPINARLFDLWDRGNTKIELKKQASYQYLEMSKMHEIYRNAIDIQMVFIVHVKGQIDKVFSIAAVDFIDLMLNDEKCQQKGWSLRTMKLASDLYKVAPKIQTKALVSPPKLFETNEEKFVLLYRRD